MKSKEEKKAEESLLEIERLTRQRTSLTIHLAYDLITGEPALKVGKSRVSASGGFMRPDHIDTFQGIHAVTHAISTISAAIPVP